MEAKTSRALPPRPDGSVAEKRREDVDRDGLNLGEVTEVKGYYKILGRYGRGELTFHRRILHGMGLVRTEGDEWNLLFSMRVHPDLWKQFQRKSRVNYIPGIKLICRKDLLHKRMKLFEEKFPGQASFWPQGFQLPEELPELRAYFQSCDQEVTPIILKPPRASNGRRIRLITCENDIQEDDPLLKKQIPLAQVYIDNPLLIGGYKFTCRIYGIITGLDALKVHVFNNGLVRLCTKKYDTSAESYLNAMAHIDSYELNEKNADAFIEDMENSDIAHDGIRVDVQTMLGYFAEKQGMDKERVWNDIKDAVVKTVLSVEGNLVYNVRKHVPFRKNCYEILGYDFLIDSNFKVWVLEINHTPSMKPHTDLENDIKHSMLYDLFTLADVPAVDHDRLSQDVARKYMQLEAHRRMLDMQGRPTGYKAGEFKILELNRGDLWTLVDFELEQERGAVGNFERVFPHANSDVVFEGMYRKNRNQLLIDWMQKGLHTDMILTLPANELALY